MRTLIGSVVTAVLAVSFVGWGRHWPTEMIGTVWQFVGIALALSGVPVVRDLARRAGKRASNAQREVTRRLVEGARALWSRLGFAKDVSLSGSADSASLVDSANLTVLFEPVNRETVTDREWLEVLDDRVDYLLDALRKVQSDRLADRTNIMWRLTSSRQDVEKEIQRELRAGWELIVSGLGCSAVGTIIAVLG